MRKIQRITQEPFTTIISREWLRAKRILPQLRKKPKLYWSRGIRKNGVASGFHGICYRYSNMIYIHSNYQNLTNHKEFVLTLRHEFAHLLRPEHGQIGHGADFMYWLKRLQGSRYATHFLRELKKDPSGEKS